MTRDFEEALALSTNADCLLFRDSNLLFLILFSYYYNMFLK